MMSNIVWFCVLICGAASWKAPWEREKEETDYFTTQLPESPLPETSPRGILNNTCDPIPEGGIPWLMHIREKNLGWKQETPRALVALAFNGWLNISPMEKHQMEFQLDIEITKSVFKFKEFPMHPTQLALFINALIAINRNPRNFHGFDLVEDLLRNVNRMAEIHPFVLLTLCNARAPITTSHLRTLLPLMEHKEDEERSKIELKAIALKAFACAADLDPRLGKFGASMRTAFDCISLRQRGDGSFGSVYTTALAVQALIASKISTSWRKKEALEYLKSAVSQEKSVMGICLIEMALKSHEVLYVKDLHPKTLGEPLEHKEKIPVLYTLRNDLRRDVELTISIKVPKKSTLFDVMNLSAKENPKFRFSFYEDSGKDPKIYAADDVVNDAENNFYWLLCQRQAASLNSSIVRTITAPLSQTAEENPSLVLWYRNTDCEDRMGELYLH